MRSGPIFLMTSARLINDDDPTCRKLCAKCIKEMISRISSNERNKLFHIVFKWLSDDKVIIITSSTMSKQVFFIKT